MGEEVRIRLPWGWACAAGRGIERAPGVTWGKVSGKGGEGLAALFLGNPYNSAKLFKVTVKGESMGNA